MNLSTLERYEKKNGKMLKCVTCPGKATLRILLFTLQWKAPEITVEQRNEVPFWNLAGVSLLSVWLLENAYIRTDLWVLTSIELQTHEVLRLLKTVLKVGYWLLFAAYKFPLTGLCSLQLHSDMDKGDGQVKYFLNGEGASSVFTIDKDTGDIHATQRLDREQQAYYTLTAQARDQNTRLLEPESQFIIKVQDINDNAPRFLDGHYTAQVAEGSPVGGSAAQTNQKIIWKLF